MTGYCEEARRGGGSCKGDYAVSVRMILPAASVRQGELDNDVCDNIVNYRLLIHISLLTLCCQWAELTLHILEFLYDQTQTRPQD